MNKIAFILLSLVCINVTFGYDFSFKLNPQMTLRWSIRDGIFDGSVTLNSQTWLAIGISPEAGMIDADVILGRFDTTPPKVEDRYVFEFSAPPEDTAVGGTNDILSYSLKQTNTMSSFNFTRKLDTGDIRDHVINNGPINIVWAHGSNGNNKFGYHGTNRGYACIDLSTGRECEDPTNYIKLPPGFKIEVFARVKNARTMTVSSQIGLPQTLIVGSWEGGLRALSLGNPDNVFDLGSGFYMPNGVTWFNGSLFLAEVMTVSRYDYYNNPIVPNKMPQKNVIAKFEEPPSPQHAWKYINVGPDNKVYTSVNSPCNTCWDDDPYGAMIRFNTDGSDVEVVARGIRDTQGFDFDDNGDVWFTDNGRDNWGNDRPPDELNHITELEQHFGFPFCYGNDLADPDFNMNGSCIPYKAPEVELDAHTAALGTRFYRGNMFPDKYYGAIFVCAHGSWNREPPTGYKITVHFLDGNGRVAHSEDFARGWLQGVRNVQGRPTDIVFLDDGSMLVSDDMRGLIYRITYEQ